MRIDCLWYWSFGEENLVPAYGRGMVRVWCEATSCFVFCVTLTDCSPAIVLAVVCGDSGSVSAGTNNTATTCGSWQ